MNEDDQRKVFTNSNNNYRYGTMERSLSRETEIL
jgi:hypothetical protein